MLASHSLVDVLIPQSFTKLIDNLYVYSAYLDFRLSRPLVRILVLTTSPNNETYCLYDPVQMKEDKANGNHNTVATAATYYENSGRHGCKYGSFILTCAVPIASGADCGKWPQYVTILVAGRNNLVRLKLGNTSESTTKRYSFCVLPVYGIRYSPLHLIEFIEATRLFGAETFQFYITDHIQDGTKRLLQYYESIGVVIIRSWHLTLLQHEVWNFGQTLAIQDCLYSMMGIAQRTAFMDVDELLVPSRKSGPTWNSMFRHIWTADIAGFAVSVRYLPAQKLRRLPFSLQYTMQDGEVDSRLTKCIVNPRSVFAMGIHHVERLFKTNGSIRKLDPNIGSILHYRRCRNVRCGKRTNRSDMMLYGEILNARIRRQFNAFRRFTQVHRHFF